MNNNNKISQVSKKGLNFVTVTKQKVRSSIVRSSAIRFSTHQGAQVLVSLFGLFSLGLLTSQLFIHSAYAAFYVDVSSTSSVKLTETGSADGGSIKPSGSGTLGTGSDVVTVNTNCTAGYNLYVSATSTGSTNLNLSGASSAELQDAANYIATSSTAAGSETTLTKDTWGVGKTNSTFAGLQTYSADAGAWTPLYTATDTDISDSMAGSSTPGVATLTHNVYYGANISTAKTPGTYTGNVLYTVLMDISCLGYNVAFDANGGTGTMNDQSILTGETVALQTNAFTRSGYVFLGWSTSANGKTGTATNGIGTPYDVDYANGVKVTDLTTAGQTITLHAIWAVSSGNMQSWNNCAALNTNQVIYLTDTRDNQPYAIKKLADGKCWMVENLRLIDKSITSSDSNVSANFTVPASTDPTQTAWCNTHSSACDEQPMAYYDSTTRSSYGALYNWYTATAGTGTYSTSSGTVSSSICPKGWRLPTGGSGGEFAALDIAWGGTGADRDNANTYSTFTGGYNTGNNGGFNLVGYVNSSSLRYVGTDGYWWSSTAYSYYYAYDLHLYSDNTSVSPQDYYGRKYFGFSVRCVADNYTIAFNANGGTGTMDSQIAFNGTSIKLNTNTFTRTGYTFLGWSTDSSATSATYTNGQTITSDLTESGKTITLYAIWKEDTKYFQTASICSTISVGTTATLKDNRDNQDYTVYRFPNTGTAGTNYPTDMAGYCLMTKDLSLGYVTGGSITKGANLTLTTASSASSGTITARTGTGNWSTTDADSNLQYINGQGGTYDSHSYYSYGAAQKVCPKGWRPPTYTEYNNIASFMGGDNSTGSSTIRSAPYNFVYGGRFEPSGWGNVDGSGHYWSSTQYDSSIGFYLNFYLSSLDTSNYLTKNYGRSVRCIASS